MWMCVDPDIFIVQINNNDFHKFSNLKWNTGFKNNGMLCKSFSTLQKNYSCFINSHKDQDAF